MEGKGFKTGDKVLLYNSRLKIFAGKLKSRWKGSYKVEEAYPLGTVRLKNMTPSSSSWIVNGQRLKHYRVGEVNDVELISLVLAEEYNKRKLGNGVLIT